MAFVPLSIASAMAAGVGGRGTCAASRSDRTDLGVRVERERDPDLKVLSVDRGSGVSSSALSVPPNRLGSENRCSCEEGWIRT